MEEPGIGGRAEKQNKRRGGVAIAGARVFFESEFRYIPIVRPGFGGLFEDTMKAKIELYRVHEMHWKL